MKVIACNHFSAYIHCMSSITVRNLPEGVKSKLAMRARASGESLEALVRGILQKEAGEANGEAWGDLVRRLAEEARALPPSEPAEFDFNRTLSGLRDGVETPPDFDWWPDDAFTAPANRKRSRR